MWHVFVCKCIIFCQILILHTKLKKKLACKLSNYLLNTNFATIQDFSTDMTNKVNYVAGSNNNPHDTILKASKLHGIILNEILTWSISYQEKENGLRRKRRYRKKSEDLEFVIYK